MIFLTKLNDVEFVLNPDLIETITENPDTTIKLTNGTTYIVREPIDTVINLIVKFRKKVFSDIISPR